MNKMKNKFLLISVMICFASCNTKENSNQTAQNDSKDKLIDQGLKIDDEDPLIGRWKIDSTAEGNITEKIFILENFQGMGFRKDGSFYFLEKDEKKSLEKRLGYFSHENQEVFLRKEEDISSKVFLHWTIIKIDQNNLLMKDNDYVNGDKTPYVFLSKYNNW